MNREGIRRLGAADAGACVELSTANGWQTDEPGWRRMIAVGDGFALADAEGSLAGTVVLNRYDPGLAAIAMMLVRPTRHRQGLGRRLLDHALAAAGDTIVFLYATELGRPLYAKAGFVVAGTAMRITRDALPACAHEHEHGSLRPMRASELDAVRALDAKAQGASRRELIEACFESADRAVVAERAGNIDGFGFARILGGARVVGPIVAANDEDTVAIATALGAGSPQPVRLDVAPGERMLREWLTADGCGSTRESPLMIRGAQGLPGERRLVRVLASLAYG